MQVGCMKNGKNKHVAHFDRDKSSKQWQEDLYKGWDTITFYGSKKSYKASAACKNCRSNEKKRPHWSDFLEKGESVRKSLFSKFIFLFVNSIF